MLIISTIVLAAATLPQLPRRIPSLGGEVVLSSQAESDSYDKYHYAAVRRAGDYLYLSGVVIGRSDDVPPSPEAFKVQARQAFARLQARLRAFGVDFADVVMVNSFHDWSAPEFGGDKAAQFAAFGAVKDEFMPPPYPAWTAVGTTGLLGKNGVVEVQMIAYAPVKR